MITLCVKSHLIRKISHREHGNPVQWLLTETHGLRVKMKFILSVEQSKRYSLMTSNCYDICLQHCVLHKKILNFFLNTSLRLFY